MFPLPVIVHLAKEKEKLTMNHSYNIHKHATVSFSFASLIQQQSVEEMLFTHTFMKNNKRYSLKH